MFATFTQKTAYLAMLIAFFAGVSDVSAIGTKTFYDEVFSTPYLVSLFVIISYVFCRVWISVLDRLMVDHGALHEAKDKPHMPSYLVVWGTLAGTALLFMLSLSTMNHMAPFNGPSGRMIAVAMFVILAILGTTVRVHWPVKSQSYAFGIMVGSLCTFLLIGIKNTVLKGMVDDPYMMSLGTIGVVLLWRFLFGPWKPTVKAVVLGTFVFWVGMHLVFKAPPTERMAHILAIVVALVPAVIWCSLFLGYHKQRMSIVALMFFAGMLSTAPILFYDSLVRGGGDLQFFLFTIDPVNFSRSSRSFVSGAMIGMDPVRSTLMATLISFLFVGITEELSKFWVFKKSGESVFSSIDDVLQLGIITAIGFAFAENVLNPAYFLGFIRTYLVNAEVPQWSMFFNNVIGRSVLTTMVHVLSTGVLAYFFGIALFARPYMEDALSNGKRFYVSRCIHKIFNLPQRNVFRTEMMLIGITLSIVLHGAFNFIVTIPDILPGNPRTVGDALGSDPGSFLHMISILLLPSLLYVVGGFWLLSMLFYKKECMKERGHVVKTDTFLSAKAVA